MSKYFQVLERLERGQTDTLVSRLLHGGGRGDRTGHPEAGGARVATALAANAAVVPGPMPDTADGGLEAEAIAEPLVRPSAKLDAQRQRLSVVGGVLQGIDALFNNIDALTKGQRPMTLVLAGASATEAVHVVAMNLAQYAERKGQRVLVAELGESNGRSVVTRRHPPEAGRTAASGESDGMQIDLRCGTNPETLTRWREQVRPGADVMLVVGPPLQESLDAALLASLCSGLVIVAVEGETHRTALTVAAERARLSNTPTFGIVVTANRAESPPWLRRIVRQVARSDR